MKKQNRYYVYAHINDNGVLFYIGKGTRSRAYVGKTGRHRHWVNHVNKYCSSGIPKVIFLKKDLTNEEALTEEMFWISFYGRKDLNKGLLINKTDGGDGAHNVSEETRRKRGLLFKGKKLSEEHRCKLSKAKLGKPSPTKGVKRNKPSWNSGKKTRVPAWNRGMSPNEETKNKLREINKGKIPHYTKKVVDLTTGIVYEAASLVAAVYNKSNNCIRNHCNGRQVNKKFAWLSDIEKQEGHC